MQILGNATRPPEVGDVLKVLPDRLQSTVFAKTVKVDRITVEAGITTIYATTSKGFRIPQTWEQVLRW